MESRGGGTVRCDLGRVEHFTALPQAVTVQERPFFLVRTEEGFRLFSATCPHQGAIVREVGEVFECTGHGWRFDRGTGRCLNPSTQRLQSFPVVVEEGHLFVELPDQGVRQERSAVTNPNLVIRLHTQACIEIESETFTLLTDPWLLGPAYYGSWNHYPHRPVDISRIDPDAIWISHEHSDHFHGPTLRQFRRDIPVYVPDFPNRRMVTRLKEMGFSDVTAMAFGEAVEIGPDVRLTCYEPQSLWNDCIVLIEMEGFRMLNLNDAGLNPRIAPLVRPVDVLFSEFSGAATSYPVAWSHIDPDQKERLIKRASGGMLKMLRDAAAMYDTRYVFPCGSHFMFNHPLFREYVPLQTKHCTVLDVVKIFRNSPYRAVDILPGETWNVATDRVEQFWDRATVYAPDTIENFMNATYSEESFREFYPDESLAPEDLGRYLLRLNDVPDMEFCEDLTLSLKTWSVTGEHTPFEMCCEIKDHRLHLLTEPLEKPNYTIEVAAGVLAKVVKENISFDEAHIGFWCRCHRDPDVYHLGFWRLLHAPYYKKSARRVVVPKGVIGEDTVIADLVEQYGDVSDRILRRYGLYCVGCLRSTQETLREGARKHGIEEARLSRLLTELTVSIGSQAS